MTPNARVDMCTLCTPALAPSLRAAPRNRARLDGSCSGPDAQLVSLRGSAATTASAANQPPTPGYRPSTDSLQPRALARPVDGNAWPNSLVRCSRAQHRPFRSPPRIPTPSDCASVGPVADARTLRGSGCTTRCCANTAPTCGNRPRANIVKIRVRARVVVGNAWAESFARCSMAACSPLAARRPNLAPTLEAKRRAESRAGTRLPRDARPPADARHRSAARRGDPERPLEHEPRRHGSPSLVTCPSSLARPPARALCE